MKPQKSLQTQMKKITQTAYIFRSEIFLSISVLSAMYILFSLFSVQILIAFALLGISVSGTVYFRYKAIREKGIINLFSPKVRQVMLKRSLFDLYRDQIYYPYITKIAGVFIKGAITQPDPNKLNEMFEQLPEQVKNVIFTKGLLHLTPERVQKLIIQKDLTGIQQLQIQQGQIKKQYQQIVPQQYGKVNKQWDKIVIYEKDAKKLHQNSVSKQILVSLNQRIQWKHIIPFAALISIALMNVKGKKMAKILLYNSAIGGIFLLTALFVIKFKKPQKKKKNQNDF